ncbi:MAG: GxxExxY protein [Fibrella sp.]|nr:GxxExxY protein [Armatimonadota bacterium]
MPVDAALNRLSSVVIGAAIEVHKQLGPGFPESIYECALETELKLRGIVCSRQVPVHILYKGQAVGEGRLDLLIENSLIVELKAVDELSKLHEAQLISYLKATAHPLGLLINFKVTLLRDGVKRIVYGNEPP